MGNMALDFYMAIDYPTVLRKNNEEDGGGWIAEIIELPGCMSDGSTPDEAVNNLEEAKRCWIEVALKRQQDIPLPKPSFADKEVYSGKFTLRISKSLHRQLAETAKYEGVSLNQYVQTLIAFNFGKQIGEQNENVQGEQSTINVTIHYGSNENLPINKFANELTGLWARNREYRPAITSQVLSRMEAWIK